MLLRKTLYFVISFLFLLSLPFCKTQQESTKTNDGKIKSAKPIDINSQGASASPDFQSEVSSDEMIKMNNLADTMAKAYCEIQALKKANDPDGKTAEKIDFLQEFLMNNERKADSIFVSNFQKVKFNQVYSTRKQKCE